MNPREIGAAEYGYTAEPECPYDDSMEADDAYDLPDEEKDKLEAETEELMEDLEFPF